MTVQLAKEEVCLPCKKNGLVGNREYRNDDFQIITDNEALGIDRELSNNQNLTLVTIYCQYGNPNLSFFQTINSISDSVMFVGDFNSKLESFGCTKKKQKTRAYLVLC